MPSLNKMLTEEQANNLRNYIERNKVKPYLSVKPDDYVGDKVPIRKFTIRQKIKHFIKWKLKLHWLYDIIHLLPKVKKHGLLYLYDREWRKRVRNRIRTLKSRTAYGKNWGRNIFRVKTQLFAWKGNVCFWCGRSMKYNEATVDHIKPVSQGGGNEIQNLRLIHEPCRVERDRAIARGFVKF